MNPACKFRNILRPHQTVFHDLRIAGNGHEGRLELVGNVGRELSSHLSRFLKLLHLPGNLPVLLVQPSKQRTHLLINHVVQWMLQIQLIDRLHDLIGLNRNNIDCKKKHQKKHYPQDQCAGKKRLENAVCGSGHS